jgi:hypothetical protein
MSNLESQSFKGLGQWSDVMMYKEFHIEFEIFLLFVFI